MAHSQATLGSINTIHHGFKVGENIDGESAYDQSGKSVSLSGDVNTVAIGAHSNYDNGSNSGHVRVYATNGISWIQIGDDIDGKSAGDNSGWSVSLSDDGSMMAIGARGYGGKKGVNTGRVHV